MISLHGATANEKAGNLLHETFDSPIDGRWIPSTSEIYGGVPELQGGGLVLTEEAKRYGISTPLSTSWSPGKPFVVQYELTFTEGGLECGGAYLKMLSGKPDLAKMNESDPFTIMFGPDKCGMTNKVHLIFKHKNPVSGKLVEHHATSTPSVTLDTVPHLYTLVVRPDNTFSVFVDQEEKSKGSLTSDTDFNPPFTPPKQIPDPDDKKPEDWVDEAKIPDPEAKKPDDWDEDAPSMIPDVKAEKPAEWHDDEPLKIPDPEASQPDDWSEEDDGPWEAPPVDNPKCKAAGCGEWKRPEIPNPDYKGKWHAELIDNPAYKGEWAPQQIDNPDHFECTDPVSGLESIGALAIEVWLFKPKGPKFSNIIVGTDEAAAVAFGASTWKPKFEVAQAEAAEKAAKAAEEASKNRIAEGGIKAMAEEYFALALENPMISGPALLVFFFLLIKFLTGGGRDDEAEAAPAEGEAAEGEAAEAEDTGAPAEGLRQRKRTTAKDE